MERKNNLSENLKAYQELYWKNKDAGEFSSEFHIPKSTFRSIIDSGNTTLYTAIRIADGLGITLDELVFGEAPTQSLGQMQWFLQGTDWFAKLSPEKQRSALYHMGEIMKIITNDGQS